MYIDCPKCDIKNISVSKTDTIINCICGHKIKIKDKEYKSNLKRNKNYCGCPNEFKALVNRYKPIKLNGKFKLDGNKKWSNVIQYLEEYSVNNGIILNHFVDKSFSPVANEIHYSKPWVGIFHNPVKLTNFPFDLNVAKNLIFHNKFLVSIRHLQRIFCLSNHLAKFYRDRLRCPVYTLTYPYEVTKNQEWQPDLFLKEKKFIQIGWHLRNTRFIHQLPKLNGNSYNRLYPKFKESSLWNKEVELYWQQKKKRVETKVEENDFVSSEEYNRLLQNSVVCMEFFEASGIAALVECIVRNTPVLINPHPAIVEYLGPDYPLYFTHIGETASLQSTNKVLNAHEYLKSINKTRFKYDYFVQNLISKL